MSYFSLTVSNQPSMELILFPLVMFWTVMSTTLLIKTYTAVSQRIALFNSRAPRSYRMAWVCLDVACKSSALLVYIHAASELRSKQLNVKILCVTKISYIKTTCVLTRSWLLSFCWTALSSIRLCLARVTCDIYFNSLCFLALSEFIIFGLRP